MFEVQVWNFVKRRDLIFSNSTKSILIFFFLIEMNHLSRFYVVFYLFPSILQKYCPSLLVWIYISFLIIYHIERKRFLSKRALWTTRLFPRIWGLFFFSPDRIVSEKKNISIKMEIYVYEYHWQSDRIVFMLFNLVFYISRKILVPPIMCICGWDIWMFNCSNDAVHEVVVGLLRLIFSLLFFV